MAKQQENTTSAQTNVPVGGMVKDVTNSLQGKEFWSHARNAHNNSTDGDLSTIGNEAANMLCAKVPYTVIGTIHKQADVWFVFSTDNTNSEIGVFDESTCTYKPLVNSKCLNFNTRYLITGAAKENFDCTWQMYWDDGLNPSRTLNADNIPWKQIKVSEEGADCLIYQDTDELDCEKLRLAPLVTTPDIKLTKAKDGGLLRNGSYQAYVAYVVNGQKVTDYIGISNIQSLFDHSTNSGGLNIELNNLDKNFEEYELVILSNNQQSIVAKQVGIYSTEQSTISIDYIDQALTTVDFRFLFGRNPAYEKSDAMYVVNDYLIRQGPTEQFDFNYQPIANQIKVNWVVAAYPQSYFHKGGNKTNFMRDEVYTFFIRWIYNTGEKSRSYHIPGRAPKSEGQNQFGETIDELAATSTLNTLDEGEQNFQVYNTATVTSFPGIVLEDGGVVLSKGEMAYWQSTEKYPASKPEIWNSTYRDQTTNVNLGNTSDPEYDLCGKNIRHHKMPSEEVHPSLHLYDSTNDTIRILGVEFENIGRPKNNDGSFIENIVGYEILRGSREGAKSILAKGVFRNMRKYDIPDETTSLQGLYPNYPYNDLRDDIYFHDGKVKTETDAIRTDGCDNLRTSIEKYAPLKGYTKDVFTFHSPELMFRKPFLNASEARLYGELNGISTGNFLPSELHPKYKLLRNITAVVAGIVGIGYAIQAMQGKKRSRIEPAKVDTTGWTASPVTLAAYLAGGAAVPAAGITAALATDAAQSIVMNNIGNVAGLFTGGVGSDVVNTTIGYVHSLAGLFPGLKGGGFDRSYQKDDPIADVPGFVRILAGALLAKQKIAEGAQEIIEVVYNFVKERDFAYKHNSHGELFNYNKLDKGTRYRTKLKDQNYIGSSFQIFDGNYKVNNLFRPKTVIVSTEQEFEDPKVIDNSRYVVGGGLSKDNTRVIEEYRYLLKPQTKRKKTISMHYGALKFNFENQYGQLRGIKQTPMKGSINYIDTTQKLNYKYTSEIIFAGDTYIGRYTEKVIMPIFSDFLLGQPDEYNFDYLTKVNIPYPRFWMNTEKYDPESLSSEIISLTIIKTDDALPNDSYYLDRGDTCYKLKGFMSNIGQKIKNDPNPLFAMRYAYMYTHVNGVLDFFTESEINLAFRDWEERRRDRHYDPYEYNDINELFHSEIIKEDNFYKYDYSLSASRFITNLTSFGEIQDVSYDPNVAENCYTYYPKRLIYSLQARLESKKDFWRVFLPNNYKDFKDKVINIKPISKSGAIIFFPYQSPQMFQGVDQLETDLGTKITIGDGGLFSQPFQNITNADLPTEYGSCESARTIVNTPMGIFFISQAQGKIFRYAGSLINIANYGMKWWFNKYLPSQLLREYPELEGSTLADNPVVGIGCQTVYDTNDDIVYFTKRDYSVNPKHAGNIWYDKELNSFYYKNKRGLEFAINIGDPNYFEDCSWTISFDPKANGGKGAWLSFHDWHPELVMPSINHFLTTKTTVASEPYCPPGYTYNSETNQCEKFIEESAPAIVSVEELSSEITGGYGDIKADIVIAVDTSSADGPYGTIGTIERSVVQNILNNKGIVDGLQSNRIQIGIVAWSGQLANFSMEPNGNSMTNDISSGIVDTWLANNWNSGTSSVHTALSFTQTVMNDKNGSKLGNRTSDPNFKQYIVFVTNAQSLDISNPGCPYQSSTLGGGANAYQFLQAVYCGDTASPADPTVLPGISCNNAVYEYGVAANTPNLVFDLADNIVKQQLGFVDYVCNCPAGYTLVYPNNDKINPKWTQATGDCNLNLSYKPICRKVTCDCPEPPAPWANTTFSGECDSVYLSGPTGDPNYINNNPKTCYYFGVSRTNPSFNTSSFWRHNYRCDLFCNYYGVDYPWEIELPQNTGQMVNTLRSVEYQLESYIYKGNLQNGCGDDRWHDLDFNFDEVIIHNSEQVSGLLQLELSPKNDPFAILNYPKVESNKIKILYSKEEQKYRFNQFWDITNDRGEFSNSQQKIFNTKSNGYVRTLNTNNLDYNKPATERKKFRHYFNKILFKRTKSLTRKMLLRISNTKLLLSKR